MDYRGCVYMCSSEVINVVEVAGCPAGSARRVTAEEELKSVEWSTVRKHWSYLTLTLTMKRYSMDHVCAFDNLIVCK